MENKEITKFIKFKATKSGLPSLSERGGGDDKGGHARIISSANGRRKKPIYISTKGNLINNDHAWFVIKEGEIIVNVLRKGDDLDIKVYRVKEVNNNQIECELIESYYGEGIEGYLDSQYFDAIEAGIYKSKTYHAHKPIYYYDKNYKELRK
jgi:hypothetical protein